LPVGLVVLRWPAFIANRIKQSVAVFVNDMAHQNDRETVKEFFRHKSFLERWLPVVQEMASGWRAEKPTDQRQKCLPDYCYNILSVYRRTYFKGLPTMAETVNVTDKEGLSRAKTIKEAKQVLDINWRSLGIMMGIWSRGMRFFDLEAEDMLEKDGLLNLPLKKQKEVSEILLGKKQSQALKKFEKSGMLRATFKKLGEDKIDELGEKLATVSPEWVQRAYHWSPGAMAEFSAGMAEGQLSFLDEKGQFVGESNRANIYNFLLMAWPEIKEMLEANPKKTMSDLHLWMEPFMRQGLTSAMDIETLRDVCAPPPSGIGLSLRPLKPRRRGPSA
jgi:hypothetical protein